MPSFNLSAAWPRLFAVALALATLVGGIGLTALPAQAATPGARAAVFQSFRGGPGHPTVVVAGTWNWQGKRGFCIDFPKRKPDGSKSSTLRGPVPGMNAGASAKAKFIANTYSRTTSPTAAANAQFAIWRLQSDASFRTWYAWARRTGVVSASRHVAIERILLAAREHGPYRVSVAATPVLVGQTGSGTALVKARNGRPAAGRDVVLSSSSRVRILTVNGNRGTTGRTNRSGIAKYTFQRLDGGTALVKATVVAPSSNTVLLTLPTAGNQRLVVGTFREAAAGSVSFEKTLGRPAMVASCATDCDGVATARFSASNPAGAKPVRWTWRVGTRAVATMYVVGGRSASTTTRLMDGDRVAAEYCYANTVGGACTTATIRIPGSAEVICPAWVRMTFRGDCPCEGGVNFTFTLTAAAGTPRFYRAQVIKNGRVIQTFALPKGRAATTSAVVLTAGDRLQVRFDAFRSYQSGVYSGVLRSGTLFDMSNNVAAQKKATPFTKVIGPTKSAAVIRTSR